MSDRAWFPCACHTECVAAVSLEDGSVELSYWRYGQARKPTLGWRLRQALSVLVRGRPYQDYVVLSPDEASRLAAWLQGAVSQDVDEEA